MSEEVQALQEELTALRAECARLRLQQAQRLEKRFHRLVELIPDAVIIHEDGTLRYTNLPGLELFGANSLVEVVGRSILDFVDPAFHEAVIQKLERVRQKRETRSLPAYRLLRRLDGTLVEAEVNSSDFTDSAGQRLTMVIIRDIRERLKAEAALREREALYRRVIAAADAVAYHIEEKTGQYTFISAEIENLTGYSAQEITAQTWNQMEGNTLMRGGREGLHIGDAVALFRAGKMERWKADYRIRRSDGEWRWLSDAAIPLFDAQGKYVGSMGILQDITERKQLEEQLLQAQKMESLGRLAGGVAHDFNNLLAAILGYSELALSEQEKDHEVYDYLCKINAAAERAAGVTGQLLTFARKQMIAPQPCDLNALMESIVELLRGPLGENIRLETRSEADLWRVLIDPGQFEQALINLAINARDAMLQGGTLSIALENITLDTPPTHTQNSLLSGDYVLLTVRDTGVGIEKSVLKHIFEPFYTTKPMTKGTGLGLAIVHGIIEQNGGHIQVESVAGQGTTFSIYLPRIQMPLVEQAGVSVLEETYGTETILLVEDETVVRDMAATALSRKGYTVLRAEGGAEALILAAMHKSEIHLLLTDVVMPEMGGGEVARRIAEIRPEIKVLFTTGYTDDALIQQGSLHNLFPVLQKPYSLSLLTHHVRLALKGASFASLLSTVPPE